MEDSGSDFITVSQAAAFLKLSRPTFNSRRKALHLEERIHGAKTLLKKSDLLQIYSQEVLVHPQVHLLITENDKIKKLFVDQNTLDLRLINTIDAYGVISLLISICDFLESNSHQSFYLITNDSLPLRILKTCGFFKELERRFQNRIFWNQEGFPKANDLSTKAFLPLHYLAYRGQERKILEDLLPLMKKQNFSDEIVSYIGWIVGELADNSLTHAQGPCYALLAQFSAQSQYLEIAIGDTGKGIFSSLKENPKYKSLSDEKAFIKAFQAKVSSWPDDKERGKGLCDLLSIAMGNGSLVRVDSKSKGLFFNFTEGQQELLLKSPSSSSGGTRLCLLLINNRFQSIDRETVDAFLEKEIRK